ncbi:MAG: sodium:dicarboxylate symporter family protein, partial [Anaeromyxobacteraceae bacterium]|nr:sodium:dicarboxylate symporter family protein [Anaeromyxobacteraceae bacterium]
MAIVVGTAAGLAANASGAGAPWLEWILVHLAQPVGQIFLRLLFMLVVPVLFSALVVGVASLELSELGRMGLRMLGYTVVVSTVAVVIGLVLVDVIGPGRGASPALLELARQGTAIKPGTGSFSLVGIVPSNPIKAAADGDMIGLIFFSLFFGIGLALVRTEPAARLREVIEGLYEVSMRLIELVLRVAPMGVAALLFSMTARLGAGVLAQLAAYVGVVLLGLSLQMGVVYSLSVRFLGGMSPLAFFRGSRVAIVTAFSTASSSATLPTALRVAEEDLRLPPAVSRFVLTAGSAMNQNGTALFEGVTVLFLAQLFGVPLSLWDQLGVMGICILAGIGTAGVPAGSIPVVAMILQMYGIPLEGLGL